MKNNVLNIIGAVLVTLGLFLLIGTAGSLELDRIELTRALWQALIGLGITVLGVRLFKATYDRNSYTYYYEEENDYE